MNLLFYAINGKGMGHLNRTLVLARAARAFAPDIHVRFVVVSPLFGLVQAAGFEVVKVPDRHHQRGFHAGRDERQLYLAGLFRELCEDRKPDALVVDMTLSAPIFSAVRSYDARIALVLRRQRPETLRELRRERAAFLVDRFIVPHAPDESPISELPWEWRRRARFVGPVAKELSRDGVPEVRARYARPEQRLIVVTIGGGGFGESWKTLEAAESLAKKRASPTERWVLVYGPYYPHDVPPSDESAVRVRFEPDLLELMAAADVLLVNAGYNTIAELDVCKTPALIVPLAGTGRDDQFERARRAESEGRGLVSSLDEPELEAKLERALAAPQTSSSEDSGRARTLELGRSFLSALS